MHASVPLQAPASLAVQHSSPAPPHSTQSPSDDVVQVREPPRHVLPQHASPAPPHALHTFAPAEPEPEPATVVSHCTAGAVHPTDPQQFCPAPPHTAQPPSVQALPQFELAQSPPPVNGQIDPEGVHTPATQQPPDAHSSAAQHAWPAPPQSSQKPFALHRVPEVHASPVPQRSPGWPVGAQAPE